MRRKKKKKLKEIYARKKSVLCSESFDSPPRHFFLFFFFRSGQDANSPPNKKSRSLKFCLLKLKQTFSVINIRRFYSGKIFCASDLHKKDVWQRYGGGGGSKVGESRNTRKKIKRKLTRERRNFQVKSIEIYFDA